MKKHGESIDKGSFSLLMNPITSGSLSQVDYPRHIAAFIGEEPISTFESRFAALLDRKRFRESFNAYANKIEDFSAKPYYAQGVTWRKSLAIFKSFFLRHPDVLTEFSRIRDSFERALTYGNYGEAERLLEEMLADHGESIWYIRARILLMSYQGKSKELGDFCDSCIAKTKDGFVANIVNCLYAISNSDNSSRFLNKLVANNINELEKAGVGDASSFIRIIFNPFPLIDNAEKLACLNYLQVTPLIDQYSLLLELFRRSLANGQDDGDWRREVENFSRSVREKIDDWSLAKIESIAAGKSENAISGVGKKLLDCYEEGRYQEVIDSVGQLLSEAESPIAYVNVIAKSLAYLGGAGFGGVGPFFEIIEGLERIYKFDSGQEVAEESLISTAVKLNGLLVGAHVQAAILKVSPHKYGEVRVGQGCMAAVLAGREVTPLTFASASSERIECIARSGSNVARSEPGYRSIRRKICSLILSGDVEGARKLFPDLERACVLRRDYLDLFTDFALKNEETELLIEKCAESLSADSASYGCFPMEYLVGEINRRAIASLDAVLVCFFYSRKVSPKNDSVLNETFEEYLISSGVERPSQLVSDSFDFSDPRQQVFIRSVCVPEIMDYLSCFDGVNDLRAERIQLLEILKEKRLITEKDSDEVQDIYGQIIVDQVVGGLNGAKISVDDTSILKKSLDVVDSLLTLYRGAKDSDEDKFVLVDDGGDDFAVGLLAGDKNAAVVRLCGHVTDLFLYDEKFGLDRNLSAEIRHGFFSNLMRSRLENAKLLNEADASGDYQKNEYWYERNPLITDGLMNRIDGFLSEFSSKFNGLVEKAEEWMKIVKSESESRIFSFEFSDDEYHEVRAFIEHGENAETVCALVIDMLWKKTEAHLEEMRERLSVEFKGEIDGLFDELANKINDAKGGAVLVELMGAIAQAKSDIKEDINIAVEWFTRGESLSIDDIMLDKVVEVALSSFRQIKCSMTKVTASLSADAKVFSVRGGAVKPFVISLINLLDNCYKRSGLAKNTSVEISARVDGGIARVSVSNDLSEECSKALTDEAISAIDKRLRDPSSVELMRKEGGTGLSKAFNQMRSVSDQSDLLIGREDDYFVAEIIYAA